MTNLLMLYIYITYSEIICLLYIYYHYFICFFLFLCHPSCYIAIMREPTYFYIWLYLSRIYLSELCIRFLHYIMLEYLYGFPSFLYWTFSQGNILPLTNYKVLLQKFKSGKLTYIWSEYSHPRTFKLLDVLILTGLY